MGEIRSRGHREDGMGRSEGGSERLRGREDG